MQKIPLEAAIRDIIRQDPRYPRDAYELVRESLDHTLKLFKKNAVGKDRHITGQELLEGLRRYALDQYGPLAFTVLAAWNLHSCEDIGGVVFNMVNAGVLGKTEQDKPEDFKKSYDFEEAFRRPFEPSGLPSPNRSIRPAKSESAQSP